jgi:hypothetical protein
VRRGPRRVGALPHRREKGGRFREEYAGDTPWGLGFEFGWVCGLNLFGFGVIKRQLARTILNFRALCGADLATHPPEFWRNLLSPPSGSRV